MDVIVLTRLTGDTEGKSMRMPCLSPFQNAKGQDHIFCHAKTT